MRCKKCGQELPGGAAFCPACGTKVEAASSGRCPGCGAVLDAGALFCQNCGRKANSLETPVYMQGAGRLLDTIKLVSLYNGEPMVGAAQAIGTLLVYDNRLEFKKQIGNALVASSGLIGMAVSHNSVKKNPVLTIPLSRVTRFKIGKYGGIYNTLVITTMDGKVVSFCPSLPGSDIPQKIINLLRPYL